MSKGKVFVGTLVAAAAGLVTGWLTAPKSGKETRSELKDRADKAHKEAQQKAEEVKGQVNQRAAELKTMANDKANELKTRADDLKERANKAVEGARAGAEKKPADTVEPRQTGARKQSR